MTMISKASKFDPKSSDLLRAEARLALNNQKAKTVTVLSSLLAVHDELGYLPIEALEEISIFTNSSVNEVWSVASFYPNFRFTPPALHSVEICWGPTCHVLGAQQILQGVVQHLGLEGEGDTDDGEISLKYNTCLGVCPHAPAVSIDHRLVGHASLEGVIDKVKTLLEGSKNKQGGD
ncbi:MAG: hypothetical protein CL777_04850 [Chloroflexi bacterium]|jgi:NADH:ubiquinone oxidoreductase subunit E|nr:hypothetical protein [Chloroflexota bacterium]MBI68057.1 hypothetical protein [Chloroflexota bacterium]|tara:strand:- start:50306 stop:50836 length:531 start_codon:yes stop_codon:yes gene_type:complete